MLRLAAGIEAVEGIFMWFAKPVVSVVSLSLVVLSFHGAPAGAAEPLPQPPAAIEAALNEVDALPAVENDGVELPESADDPASMEVGHHVLEMTVPASGVAESPDDATEIFTDEESSVAVQSTDEGVRALVHIDSVDAPERFEFDMGGDVAALKFSADGGVVAMNDKGEAIAVAPAPWAVDADGGDVPTHFEIAGTTLTQIVEHRGGDYAYGIVADPWWNPFSWPWGKWVKKSESMNGAWRVD